MVCGAQLVLGTDGCSSAKKQSLLMSMGSIWWNAFARAVDQGLESYGGGKFGVYKENGCGGFPAE